MFEVITDKLQNALGRLNSKGRLSESDIDSALREIRRALLESDVNFQVAREFVQSGSFAVFAPATNPRAGRFCRFFYYARVSMYPSPAGPGWLLGVPSEFKPRFVCVFLTALGAFGRPGGMRGAIE